MRLDISHLQFKTILRHLWSVGCERTLSKILSEFQHKDDQAVIYRRECGILHYAEKNYRNCSLFFVVEMRKFLLD